MALLHVLDSEGRELLVHSSVFDGIMREAQVKRDAWEDVWRRIDERTLPKPDS